MIKVLSGKDKSRIQYKRNGYIGTLGIAEAYLVNIDERNLSDDEKIHYGKILVNINHFRKLLKINKGSKIEIINIK